MTARQKEFFRKLADLCEEYDAGFSYTTDDDGIHVEVEGDDFVPGLITHPWAVKELRDFADRG